MALDSMSDSCLFQFEEYLNSNPYRGYVINKPYIPLSAHSNRRNKPSSIVFRQFNNNQSNPLTLDRLAYKLRMKSALNVNTLRESHRHKHHLTNSPINEPIQLLPRVTTTKTSVRQPTARTRTTNSVKTVANEEFQGIEGNAVHVGTLNDLIKHFHQEETRLIRQPITYLDHLSTHISNNRLINDRRSTSTVPPFATERLIKQPQAPTEYRFKAPTSPRALSRNLRPNISRQTNQSSLKQQSITSRTKTLPPREKQVRICNKLTIIDPFTFDNHPSIQPSSSYIIPPIRPFGYFIRKSIEDLPPSTPLLFRRKQEIRKVPKNSLDSIDQLSTDDSRSMTQLSKSLTTLTDLEEDLDNPPNTRINMDLNEK